MVQNKSYYVSRLFLGLAVFTFIGLCSFLLSSSPAMAQNTACDPEYMDALEARAWLEAQREISHNADFIARPDSVLEYTCFDQLAIQAGKNFDTSRQFSETDWFAGIPPPLSDITTNASLYAVVGIPFKAYVDNQFKNATGEGYINSAIGLRYVPKTMADWLDNSFAYECTIMQDVWKQAKCLNFLIDSPGEDFYDFIHHASKDPRDEPPSAMCDPPPTSLQQTYQKALNVAFNGDAAKFSLIPDNGKPSGGSVLDDGDFYKEDPVTTHLDKIEPGNCDHGIQTGIMLEGATPTPEIICTNPGCSSCP